MASPFAELFMSRLQEAERSKDAGPLAELFAADAALHNLSRDEPWTGADGARRFWDDYLAAFADVRSEFHHVAEGGGTAVLEWASEGALPNGHPIRYRGVSVLEVAGDRVRRFRTYYDSAAFVATKAEPVGAGADR